MRRSLYLIILSLFVYSLGNAQQRTTCPPDTLAYALEKATGFDTISLETQITNGVYQYFEAPQDINLRGVRFYAYKTDTTGGDTMHIKVELRRATSDSVPGTVASSLLASANLVLSIPDSLNGPMSAYAIIASWSQVTVNVPYCIVVKTNSSTNHYMSFIINNLSASIPDGNQEWLSGVRQGTSWIQGYSYFPYGNAFDADFLIEPIVQYNLNATFINDPECLFNELGEYVQFWNDGAQIADHRMYNRFAFHGTNENQRWNFGDGSGTLFQTNPNHFYPSNGPYVASLSARILTWSQDLCISSVTQIIKEKPEQDFSYTTTNLDVQFQNETFGLYTDIYYDFGDGNHSLSPDPKHKYAKPGTYWVCQTMNTSCGEITQCKNVAVATNTALNCGKDTVKYTSVGRGTDIKTIKLKNTTPKRLLGVGQIFDVTQPMIVHGFTFYGNHEGLFKDSYPVKCSIFKKGSNKLPEGDTLATSVVHINKADVDTNYSDTTRYTAIFDKAVNLDYDFILLIEYDGAVPVHIGVSDWVEHDGDGDLLAIGKINDTTWVTAASVAVFNCEGAACDCDIVIEPLVEYNVDANFGWDFDCLDYNAQPVTFTDSSSAVARSKVFNRIAFYGSSVLAYDWNFDDSTSIQHLINPLHSYSTNVSGPYDVSLTIKVAGWTNDTCVSTQIHPIVAHPVGGWGIDPTLSLLSEYHFIDSSINAAEYWWTFDDETFSSLANPIHYYTSLGTFEVCQYVSNECGSDTICDSVTVNVLGIPQNFLEDLTIYPIPAHDVINVKADLNQMGSLTLSIFDMSGRMIRTLEFNSSNSLSQLNVSDIARGTYMLSIKAGQFEGMRKIILE